jgi:hypothetical protein
VEPKKFHRLFYLFLIFLCFLNQAFGGPKRLKP